MQNSKGDRNARTNNWPSQADGHSVKWEKFQGLLHSVVFLIFWRKTHSELITQTQWNL